ncbi:hypothetical protein CL629_00665 [bacterium]|nr:hypothetical protein [bacterium]
MLIEVPTDFKDCLDALVEQFDKTLEAHKADTKRCSTHVREAGGICRDCYQQLIPAVHAMTTESTLHPELQELIARMSRLMDTVSPATAPQTPMRVDLVITTPPEAAQAAPLPLTS